MKYHETSFQSDEMNIISHFLNFLFLQKLIVWIDTPRAIKRVPSGYLEKFFDVAQS